MAKGQFKNQDQLAITLYCFDHFGNAAGLDKVSKWSGYGKGTGSLAMLRVMAAFLCKELIDEGVSIPTEHEKEEAKKWVEKHSCKEWCNGWCIVDGTLITLYNKPCTVYVSDAQTKKECFLKHGAKYCQWGQDNTYSVAVTRASFIWLASHLY